MPEWRDATAMFSDVVRYNKAPIHFAINDISFKHMSQSGRYLLHASNGHKVLEWQHPFVTVWIHNRELDMENIPEQAAATWTAQPEPDERGENARDDGPIMLQPEAGGLVNFINNVNAQPHTEIRWATDEMERRP